MTQVCAVTGAATLFYSRPFVGMSPVWETEDEGQRGLLGLWGSFGAAERDRLSGLVSAKTSSDKVAYLQFLDEHGFEEERISFPFGPDNFAVASHLNLNSPLWAAQKTVINDDQGRSFSGMLLGVPSVRLFCTKEFADPIIAFTTDAGEQVRIIPDAKQPESPFELIATGAKLAGARMTKRKSLADNARVAVPEVVMDVESRSLLEGIRAVSHKDPGQRVTLALGKEKISFRLSARRPGVVRMPDEVHQVRTPFLIVVTKNGVQMPLLTAYVTPDNWQAVPAQS